MTIEHHKDTPLIFTARKAQQNEKKVPASLSNVSLPTGQQPVTSHDHFWHLVRQSVSTTSDAHSIYFRNNTRTTSQRHLLRVPSTGNMCTSCNAVISPPKHQRQKTNFILSL